jgi:uncharacterized protein YlzI (FlbEa/FlbD family)
MKYLAPFLILFSLISLTDPNGLKVWVAREQITSVLPPTVCGPNAHAKVNTGDTFICVRETVEEVVNRLTSP